MTDYSIFTGIDVSKLKHDVAVMNPQQRLLCKPFDIGEDRAGYQFLCHKLLELKEKHQAEKVYIGLEATADYWKNVYYFLKEQSRDFRLTVINPVQTRAFAKAALRRAKTDTVNAKDIARYMVEKKPTASLDRPPLFEHIKDLDTQLYALKKQQGMAINRLRNELTKVAPEIERASPRMQGRQILALLAHLPTAEAISKASVEELARIRYGKKQWRLPMPFINKMQALAEGSIAHKKGDGSGFVVKSLVRNIDWLDDEIGTVKKQMLQLYQQINPQESILTTIKGLTKETAAVLEAYIGDVARFPNSKTIVAYFGLNPTVRQSGAKTGASYLEKKGSPKVRHRLYMATLSMIARQQQPIYGFYRRMIDAGKPKLVAISAATRKLLVIIYSMLKNQTPFKETKDDETKKNDLFS
jgi:transposase